MAQARLKGNAELSSSIARHESNCPICKKPNEIGKYVYGTGIEPPFDEPLYWWGCFNCLDPIRREPIDGHKESVLFRRFNLPSRKQESERTSF